MIVNIIDKFGYELKKKKRDISQVSTRKAEGFPGWLKNADEAGMDVNDYICSKMGSPVPTLEMFVFPYLRGIREPEFVEIGIGTGRWSRDIANELRKNSKWKLYLIDHSPWIVNFLSNYFQNEKNIIPLLNDGNTIPIDKDNSIDIAFSNGTFIEFSLQTIYAFSREFKRIVKKNGYAIFNYIDADSDVGFTHMTGQAKMKNSCFTYHSAGTIDRILNDAGFDLIKREVLGNSTYVVFRKS